jgi:hypothetical protein
MSHMSAHDDHASRSLLTGWFAYRCAVARDWGATRSNRRSYRLSDRQGDVPVPCPIVRSTAGIHSYSETTGSAADLR